ncbi:MAG: chemotaxis protein, partial [Gammaproteobacteria bacterium]|nr:chemotaxis protein [Gammaproteobacteria bacterium]
LARQEATRLRSWEQSGRLPEQEALFELANAMLSIEEAARQLETKGMTAETDALATGQRPANDFLYLNEALYVVIEEAKAALTLAKRAVTAFIESGYDKMHLANVPATLRGVWGGMIMLEDEDAAALLNRIIRSVDINLLESQEAPDATLLEALADALTSLEYYIEGQGQRRAPNPELIKLAATSLAEVGL